jgi:hypothetical protein
MEEVEIKKKHLHICPMMFDRGGGEGGRSK